MTADFRMALLELLRQYQGQPEGDTLREGLRWLAQQLMEAEVGELIGAARYERAPCRATYRNGYRPRRWDTRVGTVELQIPKLRRGSYFPSLLEPRRRAERALLAVVQEAYVHGVSTRKVEELVQALGMVGLSKSEVSRICAELDERMEGFRSRPLEGEYPYVWLDAKGVKVRQEGRVVNMAAVIAVGVRETGEREVLGFDVGAAETYEFWLEFLRSLVARGLKGVRLVTSDAHEGLKRAIGEVLAGATWQRCRVHFLRNLLARVPKHAQSKLSGAGPHPLCPAGSLLGLSSAGGSGVHPATAVSPGRQSAAGGGGGRVGLHGLPLRALAGDPLHQHRRAAEPGASSAVRRGGHLPQPRGCAAAPRRPAGGAAGRLAGAAAVLQPGVHGEVSGG